MLLIIQNIIQNYKEIKAELDQKRHDDLQEEKKKYSIEHFCDTIKPKIEQNFSREVAATKAATLQAVENILLGVDRHIANILTNVNREALADVEGLKGLKKRRGNRYFFRYFPPMHCTIPSALAFANIPPILNQFRQLWGTQMYKPRSRSMHTQQRKRKRNQ